MVPFARTAAMPDLTCAINVCNDYNNNNPWDCSMYNMQFPALLSGTAACLAAEEAEVCTGNQPRF